MKNEVKQTSPLPAPSAPTGRNVPPLSPPASDRKAVLSAKITEMQAHIYDAEQDGNDCIDYGSLDRLYEEYADLPASPSTGERS